LLSWVFDAQTYTKYKPSYRGKTKWMENQLNKILSVY
jgi:hypothetical protein